MSDAEWDADNFEANIGKPVVSDKWEGEDEDEEIRDNWDDEDEPEKKDLPAAGEAAPIQVKKKKALKEKLAEKAEKGKKELEVKRKQNEEVKKQLTPKQQFEEKLRRQRLQEEADLALAIDAFGFGKEEPPAGLIDGFEPKTKEDFDKFNNLLCEKIVRYDKSPFFVPFMENLVRDLGLGLEGDDLKKISSSLNVMYNEKIKQQKMKGKKKPTKKATLVVEKDITAVDDDDSRFGDEYDDYR